MHNFTLHHLRVETEAETPVLLNPHKGSAIRGALFHALRGPDRPARDGYTGFCTNKAAPSCWECPLHESCPVSTLVATLDEKAQRGRNVPRPYIIRPPLDNGKTYYGPGETFTFDLALCADALRLFPYVVMALERLHHEGLGRRGELNNYQRGTLRILRIQAVHPLSGETRDIRPEGMQRVQMPDLPATHAQVLAEAEQLPVAGKLALEFHTPTRLISEGHTMKQPEFRPLLHRLITRLEQLSSRFSDTPLSLDVPALLEQAEQVKLVQNQTRWVELDSYSTRRRSTTPIGGLVGCAVYEAEEWRPFRPWLIWGSLLGVGKNTVKGDGWYTIHP